MALFIMVIGEPGTGKSTGIETLNPADTVIIQPNDKSLPFKGWKNKYSKEKKNRFKIIEFSALRRALLNINDKAPHVKNVIIEDLTHFFTNRQMNDANIQGYSKWSDMAIDCFWALVDLERNMRDDVIVWLIGHTAEKKKDDAGNIKYVLQTPGRFLEEKIKLTSYFTYVLHSRIIDRGNGNVSFVWQTQNDGTFEAKSPRGCLEYHEANDMAAIRAKIIAYENDDSPAQFAELSEANIDTAPVAAQTNGKELSHVGKLMGEVIAESENKTKSQDPEIF